MKLGLCRYCSDYAELDYGLCARCLDFELDRKHPSEFKRGSGRYYPTPTLPQSGNVSAANNPALLRCSRCTLIIRKEGECPYCESTRKSRFDGELRLAIARASHIVGCPEEPMRGDDCETCPEAAVIRRMKADLDAHS